MEGSAIRRARSRLAQRTDTVALWLVPALVLAATIVVPLGSSGVRSIHVWGGRAGWVTLLAFPLLELGVCLSAPRRWWYQLHPTWYHGVWVVFLAVATASAAWSVAPRASFERALAMGIVALAAMSCIWRCTADPRFVPRLIWAFGVGMAAILILSLALGTFDPSVGRQSDIQPGKLVERWRGIFESPNELALQALLLVPLGAAIGFGSESRRTRYTGIAVVGGALLMILLSGTRSSLGIALLVVVVVLLLELPLREWGFAGPLVASVAAAIALAFAIGNGRTLSPAEIAKIQGGGKSTNYIPPPPTAAQRRNGSWLRSLSAKTFGGRTEAWSKAAFEIGRRPGGGWGFATEPFVIGVFKRVTDPSLDQDALAAVRTKGQPGPFTQFTGGYVENSYVGSVVQLGALGGLLLALQLVPALVGAWATHRRRDPYQTAAAGLLISAALIAIVETFLWTAGNLATLATWAAAAVLVRNLLADSVRSPDGERVGRRTASPTS